MSAPGLSSDEHYRWATFEATEYPPEVALAGRMLALADAWDVYGWRGAARELRNALAEPTP